MKKVHHVITIDFDGTLVDWDYPSCGKPKDGAREALTLLRFLGYYVLIWSCRTCNWFPEVFPPPGLTREKLISDMRQSLEVAQIPYDEIDDGTRGKPLADFYIDDKAIRFQDNWPQIAQLIAQQSRN